MSIITAGSGWKHILIAISRPRRRWEPPPPDGDRPEAEWGFEPQLRDDVEQFARRHRFRIRWIVFEQPEQASPLVADMYQWWNQQRGVVGKRLLIESFYRNGPYRVVRTGWVPFWMVFNKQPSAEALESYLDSRDTFERIHMMLLPMA